MATTWSSELPNDRRPDNNQSFDSVGGVEAPTRRGDDQVYCQGMDSSLSQLTTATGYASTQEAVYTGQQSSLLSADPATVATDLKTAEVQQQALLGVTAALSGAQDLFDYLK